ncbi:MAG: helix-turn-helix domain-containing protein [Oscillospiraceae bacterium]|nr:helix-turn-helix domain-containing protein [Oscillospiraceae bacterium]
MPIKVHKRVAEEIVQAVKDVCGHDINFIDPSGRIFASTNPERVGQYHEAGRQAAKTGETMEVRRAEDYFGAQPGVNIPLSHDGEPVAVIGITGEPEEVRKYAVLAQKVTALILREHELERQRSTERAQMDHVVRALALGEHLNYDYYRDFMERHGADLDGMRTAVILRTHSGDENLTRVKSEITRIIRRQEITLYTFCYPHEFILLPEPEQVGPLLEALAAVEQAFPGAVRTAVGSRERLSRQSRSYEAARIALRAMAPGQCVAKFEDLDLEILLGSISAEARERFRERTGTAALTEKDQSLLRSYFAADRSLKQTCETLYLHKNTLQYQLNRIHRETGYNPRTFADAVVLYLALKLE